MTTERAKTFQAVTGEVYELEDHSFTEQLIEEARQLTPGERLQVHRHSMGWSQVEAARRLRVSPSMLNQWEKGDRLPSLSKAAEIAEKLDINPKTFAWNVLQAQVVREGMVELLGELLGMDHKGQSGTDRHDGKKATRQPS
jgi:DNA-binding XRE family transcriptional regulator